MILRGKLSGVNIRVLAGCAVMVSVIVAGIFATVGRVSADNAMFWDDVTAAVAQTSDEPGVTWKSWYQPNCHAMVAIVEDYGQRGERDVCVVSSEHAQLAVFEQSPAGNPLYALKRSDDEVFHRIANFWPFPSNIRLLPNDMILGASTHFGDTMVLFSLDDLYDKTVTTSIPTGPDTHTDVYEVDMSSRYLFSDAAGVHPVVNSVAVSKNGRFAVAQVIGWGLARVDLQTRAMKLITTDQNNSGPTALAISNDGNTVAVTGSGSIYHKVYAGLHTCGSEYFIFKLKGTQLCHSVSLSDKILSQLAYGTLYNPEFLDGGHSFMVRVWNETQQQSRKLVFTPDADSYRLEYLAMGDSYSSGEGDIGRTANGKKYYLNGTDSGEDSCHISSRSYPFLLRDYLGISSSNGMRSVACSGAQVTPDMYGNLTNYLGQNGRLNGKTNLTAIKQESLEGFTPGHIPQIEFVRKYQPKLVTLTGGGNDVGFVDVLRYCAVPEWYDLVPIISDCQYVNEGSNLAKQLANTIDTQYYYNKKLITSMQAASPTSKIVLVGYPSFISEGGVSLCIPNSGTLTIAEIKMINKMVDRMNGMLKRLAHDTSISYVDITNSLNGGRICEGSEYMTAVWKNKTGNAGEVEQFHPNAEGHKRMAKAIENAGISLPADTVPSAGDYTPSTSTKETKKTTMVENDSSIKVLGMTIKIDSGILKTLSQFTITVHSTPTQLGQFTTGADGSVDMTLPLDNVGIGRHVLVLDGTSEEGNPIELFQFVEVKASATDADGDGIPDDQDPCQYITSWYDEETGEDVCAPARQSPLAYSVVAGKTNGTAVRTTSQTERHDYASATHDDAKVATIAKPLLAAIPQAESKTVAQGSFVGVILGAVVVVLLGVVGWVYANRKSKE